MIKKISKIKVKMGTDGTLDLIECPVKLYKDSYNNIKLSCLVPETEQTTDNAILKVYASSYNTSGDKVWTSQTYNLPYSEDLTIDGFIYREFVDCIPQEFCQQAGNLTLTFAYEQTDGEDEATEIITSGDLTLYIDGQGLNTNSIKISAYEQTVAKVNSLTMNKVDKVPTAVSGNLASFVDGGGVEDSGIAKTFVLENKEYIDNGDSSTLEEAKSYTDNQLQNYTLSIGVGSKLLLSINNSNYVMTISLLNENDTVLSTQSVDLPLESMIVNASYSNGVLTLTLQNGQTLNVDISDIVDGLVPESRTINGKPLTENITLTNEDVGAPSVNDLNDGLATKININQGVSNAGKVLTVGEDGTVIPESTGSSGTSIEINGELQSVVQFNSDPQTQLDQKLNVSDVDDELSNLSKKPVQNKVITNKLDEYMTLETNQNVNSVKYFLKNPQIYKSEPAIFITNTDSAYTDNPSNTKSNTIYFNDQNNQNFANVNAVIGGTWNALNMDLKDKSGTSTRIEYVASDNGVWGYEPVTSNLVNLGANTRRWKDLYLAGTIYTSTGNISDGDNTVSLSQITTMAAEIDNKLNKTPTLLWQGSVATTNETITLSQSITAFTLIYFTATNESGEMYSQMVLSSDLQQTNNSNFYNIANSHSNVARYINLYQNGNTNLTIGGAENLTLNKVYGF